MGNDVKKVTEAAGQFADKAAELGTGVAEQAAKGFQVAQEAVQGAVKDANYRMQMQRYNPLFPEKFNSDEFALPKMLVIVDGNERKDIEVCKGAIGWTSKEAQLNVVHLYNQFVDSSGITFSPLPKVDTVYLVDENDTQRYIEASCYFSTIESEKTAELIEVGRCLGAKKCTVKTYESKKQVTLKKSNADLHAAAQKGGVEATGAIEGRASAEQTDTKKCETLMIQEFAGSSMSCRPALYWFKNDPAITNLVESFCGENNVNLPKKIHREVSHLSSSTMSSAMAGKVEAALKKMDAQFNFSFEGEVKRESRQTWSLDIEF